jgi:hypothetical protein
VALRLHDRSDVAETRVSSFERRRGASGDRRKNSRSGRRDGDPRVNWRRIAWLFAAYAVYVSVRSLPATVQQIFTRSSRA